MIVHGRFEHRAAGSAKLADETGEKGGIVVVDTAFPDRLAVVTQDVDLAESFVRVDADVVACGRFHGLPRWFVCPTRHDTRGGSDAEALPCLLTPMNIVKYYN